MREKTDQKNSEYWHFLRSDIYQVTFLSGAVNNNDKVC